jgi:acyl-CoA reductase-like NAD-dependent aldehyde dehydrogenase
MPQGGAPVKGYVIGRSIDDAARDRRWMGVHVETGQRCYGPSRARVERECARHAAFVAQRATQGEQLPLFAVPA